MPLTADDDLLSKDQAAAFLHVSKSTVDRLIADDAIEYVRVGRGHGRIKFTERALLDYLNKRVTRAAKAKAG